MKTTTVYTDLDEALPMDGDASVYRRLWSAVLLQAVRDLSAAVRRDEGNAPKHVSMAFSSGRLHRWFASDDMTPGAFSWICSVLDMDVASLRRKLLTDPHVLTGMKKST